MVFFMLLYLLCKAKSYKHAPYKRTEILFFVSLRNRKNNDVYRRVLLKREIPFYGSSGLSVFSLVDELVTKESPAFHLERVRGVKGLRIQVMDFNRLYYNEVENDSFRHGLLIAFPINLVLSFPWPLDPLNPLSNQPN